MNLVPKQCFLTRGFGSHQDKIASFEWALRQAGIHQYNLVKVSSILPPECQIVDAQVGWELLKPGEVVFTVMSEIYTKEAGQEIAASVGLAVPEDKSQHGYVYEYHCVGNETKMAAQTAEKMAAILMATRMGVTLDSKAATPSSSGIWNIDGKKFSTTHTCQITKAASGMVWTCALSAVVFTF